MSLSCTLGAVRRGCVAFRGLVGLAATLVACTHADSSPPGPLAVGLDTTHGAAHAAVVVSGLSAQERAAWRPRSAMDSSWTQAFRVSVAGGDSVPIVGRYAVSDSALEFRPLFPFDPGREYVVVLAAHRLAGERVDSTVRATIQLPSLHLVPSTRVVRVYPTTDLLPENQLRLYIEFSAPMSRDAGLDFVHLLDAAGVEESAVFLPVDGDFWNGDHTRYTLFFDPGRVKSGILPNRQMGRALRAGRRYTLRVDSTWRDGRGMPLVAGFSYPFRAGPADTKPIVLTDWHVTPPRAGTRDPLVVAFPEPLDHGLLNRALGVETARGTSVEGEVVIPAGEREWRFVPRAAWTAARYSLVVLEILEDLAGNRVNRPFEVDRFTTVDSTPAPSRFTVPFVVR